MISRGLIISLLSITLAACQTTGGYEQALNDPDFQSSTTLKLPASDPDSNSEAYEPSNYRIANLQPSERPSIETEEAGLWMMVDNYEERLATSARLYEDPELQKYLQSVTCRIAGPYCDDIRTYVVDNPYFNASMMPNGVMQIHTGLLLRVHNEAQLAAIIGHEIGHYLRRHSLQRMLDIRDKAAAAAIFQLAMIAAGTPQFNDIVNVIIAGSVYSFSRDNEREADGYGLVLMSQAGYDPIEAHKVWDNLIRERDAGDGGTGSVFYSTHPPSEERRAALKAIATRIKETSPELEKRQRAFEEIVSPHRREFMRNELALGKFKNSEELFTLLLEGGLHKTETLYFLGELYRLRADEGDFEKAIEAYDEAERSGEVPADLHRSKGLIQWRSGKKTEAKSSLSTYLQLKPNATDAKMIEAMLKG